MRMEIQKNKLWLKGFFPERTDDDIRRFCENFGKCLHMTRPWNRDYIFLTFASEEEALAAQANFVRLKYDCRYARLPRKSYDSGSATNSSPTISDSSASPATTEPEPSTSSRTPSPNKDKRRVRFSTDVETTAQPPPPQAASGQRANGKAKVNGVAAQPPQKTVFQNGEKIIITYVQSASSFYAHSLSKNEERHELIRKIYKVAERTDFVKEPPKFMALAPYGKGYYRAIVKGRPNDVHDTVVVTLVDIGVSLQVPCDKLKPIPDEYTKIKISNRFILNGVDDDTNESYGAKCLGSYIGKELIMECDDVLIGRLSSVRLIYPDPKLNINERIKEMQRTFNEEELIRVPAPLGVNQKLITVEESKLASGCNLITLIEASNLSESRAQIKRIQDVGNELKDFPAYTPKEGELCLVLYSGQWNRAVFIETSSSSNDAKGDSDDTCVLLIDLSKGVLTNSKSIRNITAELAHMPILPFTVAINGYDQTIDETKVANLLQKFKPMTVTNVKSIRESSDAAIYTIDI